MQGVVPVRARARWPFLVLLVAIAGVLGAATGRWVWSGREAHTMSFDEAGSLLAQPQNEAGQKAGIVMTYRHVSAAIAQLREARAAASEKNREQIRLALKHIAEEAQK